MPRDRSEKTTTLHLMPIVNLATLLVPAGLMLSQFVAMQWMAPAPMPGENLMDAAVHPVVPVVRIRADGFEVLGAENVLAGPEGRPVLTCDGPCTSNTYDYVGLRRLLGHVKAAYPWADALTLERRTDASYEVLVRTFEAVRSDGDRELFTRIELR